MYTKGLNFILHNIYNPDRQTHFRFCTRVFKKPLKQGRDSNPRESNIAEKKCLKQNSLYKNMPENICILKKHEVCLVV